MSVKYPTSFWSAYLDCSHGSSSLPISPAETILSEHSDNSPCSTNEASSGASIGPEHPVSNISEAFRVSSIVEALSNIQHLALSDASLDTKKAMGYVEETRKMYCMMSLNGACFDDDLKLLKDKICKTSRIIELVQTLDEQSDNTIYNMCMRYVLNSYFDQAEDQSALLFCQNLVTESIAEVENKNTVSSYNSRVTKSGRTLSRMDPYKKAVLNKWYCTGRISQKKAKHSLAYRANLSDYQIRDWCSNKKRRQQKKLKETSNMAEFL